MQHPTAPPLARAGHRAPRRGYDSNRTREVCSGARRRAFDGSPAGHDGVAAQLGVAESSDEACREVT
ncbi:hypothetical protein [Micromonospora arborensis]|uniref:hypothetical protein n=1 Tax=Micromonospora arborensis TaxID=2116518 RepID=UPI0011B6BD6C|nr:hypothetical protein [Micromonospora arborensis]